MVPQMLAQLARDDRAKDAEILVLHRSLLIVGERHLATGSPQRVHATTTTTVRIARSTNSHRILRRKLLA